MTASVEANDRQLALAQRIHRDSFSDRNWVALADSERSRFMGYAASALAFASTEANAVERLREALIQADLKIRSYPGADQSDVEFIRAALAQADQPSAAAIPVGPLCQMCASPDHRDFLRPCFRTDCVGSANYTPKPTTEAGSTVAAGEMVAWSVERGGANSHCFDDKLLANGAIIGFVDEDWSDRLLAALDTPVQQHGGDQ